MSQIHISVTNEPKNAIQVNGTEKTQKPPLPLGMWTPI